MDHPPIPPKCEFFYNVAVCGQAARWIFDIPGGDIIITKKKTNSYWVPIIASVAEVEWRKRAARWEDVKNIPWGEYGVGMTERRWIRYCEACNECYANALAWRKWGEVK